MTGGLHVLHNTLPFPFPSPLLIFPSVDRLRAWIDGEYGGACQGMATS